MSHPLADPIQSATLEDNLIELGLELSLSLTPSQILTVREYARLFAKVNVLRVAEGLERNGSYSLGRIVRDQAEIL